MALRSRLLRATLFLPLVLSLAHADPTPFDLAGPKLQVTVTRAGVTLPISEVPNLQPGDNLWIHANFPQSQSVHYLMVAAFLRGSTNPPPEGWFHKSEPWNRRDADGLQISVPPGAEQLIVFLAPETGGDFRTLVNAVRGRPGSFVRASQDLNQATLDRSRLNTYLAALRDVNQTDPAALKPVSEMLSRSLAIKVDSQCFDKETEQQAPCLMQNQDSLILSDGHSMTIAEALTSGPAADLAMQASYGPQANFGYYSPYIASVMDIARIMDSFHTAQYQYIPALSTQHNDTLDLMLNTPPSFHNPKSVIVVALPAIAPPQPPPLHPVDPKDTYCAENTGLTLPVEGAPLVFSTAYAHQMVLRLKTKDGKVLELPAQADAEKGGYVIDSKGISAKDFGDTVSASLHGYWGFNRFDGPNFELENAHPQPWMLDAADQDSIVVGRDDLVHLRAGYAACIENIAVKSGTGQELKTDWKQVTPNEVQVKLPLKDAHPGSLLLVVHQFGFAQPETVPLHSFAEAGHLDAFDIHAGDANGVLKGTRLDEVASLTLNGVEFTPGKLTSAQGNDQLPMVAAEKDKKKCATFEQGASGDAKVVLKDGRELKVAADIESPRPAVDLLGKSVEPSASNTSSNIQLANQDELPQDAKLTFSLRAKTPATFSRNETIEVATADSAFSTTLNMQNGGLTLEDAKIALATLDPAKAFGPSAFGQLQFRVVDDGVPGSWQPLATLVRLPVLHDLKCPADPDQPCRLTGANLFLVDSVSSDPAFANPVQVPDGFPGYLLPVPHPAAGELYLKLRDDPGVINQVALNAEPIPVPPAARTSRVEHETSKQPARAPYVPDKPAPGAAANQPANPPQPQAAKGSATPAPAVSAPPPLSTPPATTSAKATQPSSSPQQTSPTPQS